MLLDALHFGRLSKGEGLISVPGVEDLVGVFHILVGLPPFDFADVKESLLKLGFNGRLLGKQEVGICLGI